MSSTPFPLAGGTATGFNQATFQAVPQTQVPLVTGYNEFAFYFDDQQLPVDQFSRSTLADAGVISNIPNDEAITGVDLCATGYTSMRGWALIGYCANPATAVVGSIIIARCQGEYGGEIVEPPPPPPPDRCPPMAPCDILPDLSFLQEPNE